MKRAITDITIRVEKSNVTMFLTYNDNPNDYSFNNYPSVKKALAALPKKDFYFPIKTNFYRHLKINGNKTIFDKDVRLTDET